MTEWIKPKEVYDYDKEESSIVVQPLTMRGSEKFSLWDNKERKFYRENEEVMIDDEQLTVNKYIKLSDKQKERYRRNYKISRDVLYDGEEYVYDMPPSVDEKLTQSMDAIEASEQDPLNFEYRITRKKTGPQPWDVEYSVKVEKKNSASETPVVEEPEITLEGEEGVQLSDIEKKVVKAIMQKYPDYASRDKYPEKNLVSVLAEKCNITQQRATTIVRQELS